MHRFDCPPLPPLWLAVGSATSPPDMAAPVSVVCADAMGATGSALAEETGDSAARVPDSAAAGTTSVAPPVACEVGDDPAEPVAAVSTAGTTVGVAAVTPVAAPLPAAVPSLPPALAALRAATFCGLGLAGS